MAVVPAWAQIDRGQVAGFVKDQQSGVIPGATVSVANVVTKIERTFVTDAQGYYIATSLLPGTYDVSVEMAGFKKFVKTGIKLDAAAKVAFDVVLETGAVSEVLTVEANATPLQTDTAQVGRVIEARQIEDLMLNGRNPLRLPMLKAGVRGGTFNSFTPTDFGNGGWIINGSRTDENIITYDGVPGLRTRSSGAVIGLPDVDSIQEVQVLTASFAAEYGRASGGQVRVVTKGGGRDFHASAYENFRNEALDANTWGRKAGGDPTQAKPPKIDFNQFGYNVSGPLVIPGTFNTGRDKLFFFWGQEFYIWNQTVNSTERVPSEKMRQGDFSELLGPNIFYNTPKQIIDPLTGQPFPGNVIPKDRLSHNGTAFLNAFPMPTPGFTFNNRNWTKDDVQKPRQHKETLRLDFSPSSNHQVTLRGSLYSWKQLDAFRSGFQFARTDWDRPNRSAALSWLWTASSRTLNELTVGYAKDTVRIPVFTGDGQYDRTKYGINYPYLFPGKEIENKVPTVQISQLTNPIDGGPYPSSSAGPIYTMSDTFTHIRGRHTFKAGAYAEYSGEDDFDQINVQANLPGDTNNQNGRFEFTDARAGGTGIALANTALGLFTNYAEIGQRSFTQYRAWTVDLFAQDSWKVQDNLTLEYGMRWAIWQPWYAKLNNMAQFDPRYYDRAKAAVVDPKVGNIVSGDPYNGVVLPGDGWPGDARASVGIAASGEFDRLFHGLPRGFNKTHWAALEPRVGVAWTVNPKTVVRLGAGIFHNRVTLNDSTLLGGNAPVQVKQSVSNGSADNPAGATVRRIFPLVMTMQDLDFPHPTSYKASLSIQRQLPFDTVVDVAYVGTMGLHQQRERNINQLQPGTIQANPGITTNALRPYQGFGIIRLSENAGRSWYNGLQVELNRRFRGGLGFGVSYTFSKLINTGDGKRDTQFDAYNDKTYKAIGGDNRTHVLAVNYLYQLPFGRTQDTTIKKILGGWQISGVTFLSSGAWGWVGTGDDIAGVGDTIMQPWDLVGDFRLPSGQQSYSLGAGKDSNYWFNPAAFAKPKAGTFGTSGRNIIEGPHQVSWDISLRKTFPIYRSSRVELRMDVFNFLNHPNWDNVERNPSSPNFGRITTKTGQRTMQLGLRYSF